MGLGLGLGSGSGLGLGLGAWIGLNQCAAGYQGLEPTLEVVEGEVERLYGIR